MPELGTSGSVRGVSRNGHPYRDPGPEAVVCAIRCWVAADAERNGPYVAAYRAPPSR